MSILKKGKTHNWFGHILMKLQEATKRTACGYNTQHSRWSGWLRDTRRKTEEEAPQHGKLWSGVKWYKPEMISWGPCSIWEVPEDEDNCDTQKVHTINISNASLFDIRYLQPSIIQSLCYSLLCHFRVVKIISSARFFKLKTNNILNSYVMLKYGTENMKIHVGSHR